MMLVISNSPVIFFRTSLVNRDSDKGLLMWSQNINPWKYYYYIYREKNTEFKVNQFYKDYKSFTILQRP